MKIKLPDYHDNRLPCFYFQIFFVEAECLEAKMAQHAQQEVLVAVVPEAVHLRCGIFGPVEKQGMLRLQTIGSRGLAAEKNRTGECPPFFFEICNWDGKHK